MNLSTSFILFGAGNYNTLGVLHQLQEIGVTPLILVVGHARDIAKGNIIGYSKYAKQIVAVNSEQEGLDWIIANFNQFANDTIIYPTSDTAEKLLDSNFDILSTKFRFPNAGAQGAVTNLMDKHLQNDLAANAGIRTLKSQYSNSPNFSYDNVLYPCMVKPLNSTTGSKGDMKVCHTEQELRRALSNGRHTHDFIVQQYIENEADLLFLGIALPDGSIHIPAVVIKPGVSPTGEYTHAIISTDISKYLPEINEVKTFVQNLSYIGPFSIEFGLEQGKNYFFEINLRNDGTSHYPLNAGINIAASFLKNSAPDRSPKIEYEMIDEVGDSRRILSRDISPLAWIKSFCTAGSYRYYHSGDYTLIPPLTLMFLTRTFSKVFRTLTGK